MQLLHSDPHSFHDENGNELSVIDENHTFLPTLEDVDNGAAADDDDDDLVFPPADDNLGFLDHDEGILDDNAPFEFRTDDIAYFTPFNSDEQFQLRLCHLLSKTGARLSLHDSIIDLIEESTTFNCKTSKPIR